MESVGGGVGFVLIVLPWLIPVAVLATCFGR